MNLEENKGKITILANYILLIFSSNFPFNHLQLTAVLPIFYPYKCCSFLGGHCIWSLKLAIGLESRNWYSECFLGKKKTTV